MTPKDSEMTLMTDMPEGGSVTTAAPRQTLAMRLAERNRQRTLRAERLAKLRTIGPEAAPEAVAMPETMVEPEAAAPAGSAGRVEALPEALADRMAGPVPDLMPDLMPDLTPEAMPGRMVPEAVEIAAGAAPARLTPAQALAELLAAPLVASPMAVLPAAAPLTAADPAPAPVLPGPGVARDLEADAALEDFLRALTGGVPPQPAPQPAAPGEILHFHRPADRLEPAAVQASGLDQLPGAGPGLVWALGRAGLDSLAAIAPLAPEELADRLGPIGRLVPAERWVATARAAMAVPAIPAAVSAAAAP